MIESLLGRDIAFFYTRSFIYNAGARPRKFRGSHRLLIGPSPPTPLQFIFLNGDYRKVSENYRC